MLAGVVIITFLALRLVPGDVVSIMLSDFYDAEVAAQMRRLFGLDLPLHEQFGQWLTGLMTGDLGVSLRTGRPVLADIAQKFPATLQLTLVSLALSLVIGIPAGVVSATRRNTPVDWVARTGSLIGLSIPSFYLGILLILVFAVILQVLPAGGYAAPSDGIVEFLRHVALPAITLGTTMAAVTMRMTRSAMLEVLGLDYVRTARAKGLPNNQVMRSHALRNALVPVVTIVGIQLGSLLGGAVVVERIFAWPGLGTLIVDAIFARDYPVVQGAVLFLALFFVLANLIVDLLYLYLNPRLRHG